jgi:hypothetical protein
MSSRRFPIRLGRRSRPLLLLFGVRSSNAYVDLDGDLEAHFGFFHVRTPVANISSWRIEGPWLWLTAIGVRRSVRHGDITFGGSHRLQEAGPPRSAADPGTLCHGRGSRGPWHSPGGPRHSRRRRARAYAFLTARARNADLIGVRGGGQQRSGGEQGLEDLAPMAADKVALAAVEDAV